MEHLAPLLEILDKNTQHIPEGDYLVACDLLKRIHQAFKETPRVPFAPYVDPGRYRRMFESELQILITRRQEFYHKIRKNITATIRRDAIQEVGNYTTFEEVRNAGLAPESERDFYMGYLNMYNYPFYERIAEIDVRISQLRMLIL